MRRRISLVALSGFFALTCAYGQTQFPPCNAGTAPGLTILPVTNGLLTYCISDFGWSDTWLIGNPPGRYNPQDDLLSGDDAFNLKYDGGVLGQTTGWLSPVLDRGTLTAQPAPGPAIWTVKVATHYTHQPDSTESVITNADGLEITIDTFAPPNIPGVQIALTIRNTTTSTTFTSLRLADYFNFHPAGSNYPNNTLGVTSFVNNCIVTTAAAPNNNVGSACGLFAPIQHEVGYAQDNALSGGGQPVVWQDVGSNTYNNASGPVGPADSAGAMQWNLGDLAPGASVRFAVGKNATPFGPPVLTKAFVAGTIGVGASSTLTFVLNNNNVSALTGVGFTDTLPANVNVASPNGLTGTCFGVTPTVSGNTISLTNVSVPGSSSCTFSINVTGNVTGKFVNTTSVVASLEGGNGTPATSTLNVTPPPPMPPTISKIFTPSTISANGTSTLKFTIGNPNSATTLTGIGFTDSLPANVTVASPTGLTGSCPPGTITAAGGTISLSGATLPGGANCTFSVNVTASTTGTYTNTTSMVTSVEGGNGSPATAVLNVASLSISKQFNPASIPTGGTSILSFTVANGSSTLTLTGVGFSDALPANVSIATPSGLTGSCPSGSIIAAPGGTTISLSGASLAPSTSCTFAVNVTGAVRGTYVNTTAPVTSTQTGPTGTATSTLTIVAPPSITKSFTPTNIDVAGTSSLSFVITNPNTALPLTGVGVTDNLPAGVTVSAPSGLTGGCPGGTIVASGSTIMLTGATLPAAGTCTFSVNVTGPTAGVFVNTTQAVISVEGGNGNTGTATLTVGPPPPLVTTYQITYDVNLNIGDSFLDITNTGASGAGLGSGTSASVTGALCANVYVFSPDEQMVSCCSCPVTPNGLVSLSAQKDLISNTLTPRPPDSIVVKVVGTIPTANSCNNSAAALTAQSLANGLAGYNTTLHMTPTNTYTPTETRFSGATLSPGELNRLNSLCNGIIANGSGFGICRTCRLGGLGADKAVE